jgi:hypothetical protein
MACPGQRNHAAQVENGWNHNKEAVLSVQSTIQVVRYAGPARRFFRNDVIVDGYHRVEYWMSLENDVVTDGCPFEKLNVEIHTVTADTKEDALLQTDAIGRSFNSLESVKRNGDYLTAAVRQAGLSAVSSGYLTGRGSGVSSFLKHAVGKPSQPTPVLTANAERYLAAHETMDRVLLVVEMLPRLRSVRSRMFNPGVMKALFERFQLLEGAELELAGKQLSTTLSCFGSVGKLGLPTPGVVEAALYEVFEQLCSNAYAEEVRTYGCREAQYNRIASDLKKKLAILGTVRKRAPAKKVMR